MATTMDVSVLEQKIREGIPGAEVRVADLKGTGDHFEVLVVSETFTDCSLVARHRAVYAALGDAMRGEIHALMIQALDPDQYRDGLVTKIDRR